jgi:ectoine hydroxylase-related dioxygenase (phytanoyl-CoA dioxygenase family)
VVSSADRKQFNRDGYFVFDPQIDESVIDETVSIVEFAIDGDQPANRGKCQDLYLHSSCVKRMALLPRILETLEGLYGAPPLAFQTLNFQVGTEQPAHSDTIHFNSNPAGWMCGVWIALEDIGPDQGPLVYYPGSHKLPEYTLVDVGIEPPEPGSGPCKPYEQFISSVIDDNDLKPAYLTCPKGHALVWAANLLHGGSARKDRESTRYSQVTHYFFPDCTYYTPMNSQPDNPDLRDPEWIKW